MKRSLLLLAAFTFISLVETKAQVGINSTGGAPDPTSMLDVSSSNKGFLLPRLTTAQRDAISGPAESLLIYNTDTKCYNFYNGSNWNEFCGLCIPQPTTSNAGPDQLGLSGTSASLAANTPGSGAGSWSIISGSGGSFVSNTDPTTTFNGVAGNAYTLRWTITSSCGSSTDDVDISFVIPFTNYATGNAAYWAEKDLGYNDVTIGGGSVVYTYDAANKQYKNGNDILVPDKTGTPDGNTVDATSFYGFSGGSASATNFQWDDETVTVSAYDVDKMFVSPVSSGITYCQALQNSSSVTCSSSGTATITIDGPTSTLAYPSAPVLAGTYNTWTHQEKFSIGTVKGTENDLISQQQLDATSNQSYCVATYGKGWRIPNDIEAGHSNDLSNTGNGFHVAYESGTNVWMWTSSRRGSSPSAPNDNLWIVNLTDGFWGWYGCGSPCNSYRIRCVYPGY